MSKREAASQAIYKFYRRYICRRGSGMVEIRLTKKTSRYVYLYLRSSIIEDFCKQRSNDRKYNGRYDMFLEGSNYILDGYSNGELFTYVHNMYNMSVLCRIGLKDGITVRLDRNEFSLDQFVHCSRRLIVEHIYDSVSSENLKTKAKVCGYTTQGNTDLWQKPSTNAVSTGSEMVVGEVIEF